MNLSRLFWGLAILLLGIVLVGINFGLVSPEIFNNIWKLWPLILVVIGLSMLAKNMHPAISIIFSIVFVLVFGSIIAIIFFIPNSINWISKAETSTESKIFSEPVQSEAEQAQIDVTTGAAKLNIAGGSKQLIEGEVKSDFTQTDISRDMIGKTDKITLQSRTEGITFPKTENTWDIKVIKDLPLILNLNTGAASSEIDLRDTKLQKLTLNGGATSTVLTLPSSKDTIETDINLGASSVKIKIPDKSGVKVIADGGLSSQNFVGFGLQKTGEKEYRSTDYDSADQKIVLTFRTGVSSIELSKY
jgi:hypothetical protein